MKMNNIDKKIDVIKVPNEKKKENEHDLPRMPRLYLELLENKDKIKPEMVNTEFNSDDVQTVKSFNPSVESSYKKKPPRIEEEDEDEIDISDDEDNERDNDDSDSERSMENDLESEDNRSDYSGYQQSYEEEDETKSKLKAMLHNEDPPRLSDLQRDGKIKMNQSIPNMNFHEDEDEDDEEAKRELIFKFQLLKRSYGKDVDIPQFTIHSSLKKMNEVYESTLRHLSLESNVESYKQYLIAGFMLSEFCIGSWFKFDMSGFTSQQLLQMNQYDRLLVELGSKSYVPEGKQWPIEIRLLSLIAMNAMIFIVSKLIMSKTNVNLINLMNKAGNINTTSTAFPDEFEQKNYYNGNNSSHNSSHNSGNNSGHNSSGYEPKQTEQKKMRKPQFDFHDL